MLKNGSGGRIGFNGAAGGKRDEMKYYIGELIQQRLEM
jgi:hypothetical protein